MARATLLLQEIETYAENIGDAMSEPLLILDRDLCVWSANRSFYTTFKTNPAETEGRPLSALGDGQWDDPKLRARLLDIIPQQTHFDDFEVARDFPGLGRRVMVLSARKLLRPGHRTALLALAFRDVTERRRADAEMAASHRRDRRIAVALQRSLLFTPPEDGFPSLAVRTMHETASNEALVGGDFWDTFAFGQGHVALALGDVMGKGLRAAAFTAELKYALRAYVREHADPACALSLMNAYLCESHRLHDEGLNAEGDDAPVCLSLAVLRPATGEGVVCTAGMEALLLLRADGRAEEVTVHNLLLGVSEDAEYQAVPFHLEPGDTCLMTTDGITEARQGADMLGYDGLTRLARAARSQASLEAMGHEILDASRRFAGGKLADDACLVLARRV